MPNLKIYAIAGVAFLAIVGFVGKCVYDWGYDDCNADWIAKTNDAKDSAQMESKDDYNKLQNELAEAYERGVLAGYDQRMLEYEQMRASRSVASACNDRDAILQLAIDSEKALAEAIEFLKVERKR